MLRAIIISTMKLSERPLLLMVHYLIKSKKHTNKQDEVVSQIKVPIAYGPTQKFLARLEQSPSDLNNPVQITYLECLSR